MGGAQSVDVDMAREDDPIVYALSKLRLGYPITELDLSRNALRNVLPEVQELYSLRVLNLSQNHLTYLPIEIAALCNLQHVNISHNQLSVFPVCLASMGSLVTLRMANNQFEHVPLFLARMQHLEVLDLSNNKITHVPAELSSLSQLQELYLRGNRLKAIPVEIARHCKKLRQLTVSTSDRPGDSGILPNMEEVECEEDQSNAVLKLKETAARHIVCHGVEIDKHMVADELREYISSAQVCSDCRGPFFETVHRRYETRKVAGVVVLLVHHLCSPHWHVSRQRVGSMFRQRKCPIKNLAAICPSAFTMPHFTEFGRHYGLRHTPRRANTPFENSSSVFANLQEPPLHPTQLMDRMRWLVDLVTRNGEIPLDHGIFVRLASNRIDSAEKLLALTEDDLQICIGIKDPPTLAAIMG